MYKQLYKIKRLGYDLCKGEMTAQGLSHASIHLPRTLCGEVFKDFEIVTGGTNKSANELGIITCLICKEILEGSEYHE